MDYRKDMRTPRDRVDDALLIRLLKEADELSRSGGYGGQNSLRMENPPCEGGSTEQPERPERPSCGCKPNKPERPNRPSCGCRPNKPEQTERPSCGCRPNRPEQMERPSCGCRPTRPEQPERPSCGCRPNRPEQPERSSCGCRPNRPEQTERPSCGCRAERSEQTPCGCGDNENTCIDLHSLSIRTQGLPLVMAYVPDQEWQDLYEAEEALSAGTLFKELNFPLYKACRNNGCNDTCRNNGCR